jgi:asparagine synthase (glutamine-hydrolysing)
MLRKLKREFGEAVYGALISPTARAVRRDRITYLLAKKLLNMERELARVARERISGDFVEFGVALGGSSILLAQSMGANQRFHGFDVFGMIPPPSSEKDDEASRERYAIIESGRSGGIGGDVYYGYRDDLLVRVTNSFAQYGMTVDQDYISLHKGLFADTWPTAAKTIEQIAFTHIDCDWYEPVKFCLDAIADRTAPGGAIVMDDYNDYGGCRTATREFLARRPEFRVGRNFGNLIIRRNQRRACHV